MTPRRHLQLRIVALIAAIMALALAALPSPPPDQVPVAEVSEARIPVQPPHPEIGALGTVFAPLETFATDEASPVRPTLIGIAGRLPDDVEVLLRLSDGATRSARIGDTVEGWTLRSVAPDRAVFVRGGRQEVLTIAPAP